MFSYIRPFIFNLDLKKQQFSNKTLKYIFTRKFILRRGGRNAKYQFIWKIYKILLSAAGFDKVQKFIIKYLN